MKVYTKTGDKGTTSLIGGKRVSKNSLRVDLYGTVDELNAVLSIALQFEGPKDIKDDISNICNELFILGADFATPFDSEFKKIIRKNEEQVSALENKIDKYYNMLPPLKSFVNTYETKFAAFLNYARTVCRRAERAAVALKEEEEITEASLQYLNRLSDYLFTAVRYTNHILNVSEKPVEL